MIVMVLTGGKQSKEKSVNVEGAIPMDDFYCW